jgi:hypothetical protein
MKLEYSDAVMETSENAPGAIKKAFFKQTKLQEQIPRHPSLGANKYDESRGGWQARVNQGWRFYPH